MATTYESSKEALSEELRRDSGMGAAALQAVSVRLLAVGLLVLSCAVREGLGELSAAVREVRTEEVEGG